MILPAPFTGEPKEVFKTQHRFAGFTWFAAPGQVFASESNWKKRWRTTWLVDIDKPGTAPKKIFDLNTQDAYNNPGSPIMTTTPAGDRVVLQDKDVIYLSGAGRLAQGRPSLPRHDEPQDGGKEAHLAVPRRQVPSPSSASSARTKTKLILSHESKTEVPNYHPLRPQGEEGDRR